MPTSQRVAYRIPLPVQPLHATILALTSAEEVDLKILVNLKLRRIWYWLEIGIWKIAPRMSSGRLRLILEINLMSGGPIAIEAAVL